MLWKKRPSSSGKFPAGNPHDGPPRPLDGEQTLKWERILIERKIFQFALKENCRGRFVRISEDRGSFHTSIIIPASGLEDFQKVLDALVKVSAQK